MSNRNDSWLLGWWTFTRRAVEWLTSPPGDTAVCDREVETLARESWLGSLGRGATAAIDRAWRQSRSRSITSALVNSLQPAPAAAALRAAGWTMTGASATVLTLNVFRPVSQGPFTWVVPAVAMAAGVLMMVASAPLGRAFGERP